MLCQVLSDSSESEHVTAGFCLYLFIVTSEGLMTCNPPHSFLHLLPFKPFDFSFFIISQCGHTGLQYLTKYKESSSSLLQT